LLSKKVFLTQNIAYIFLNKEILNIFSGNRYYQFSNLCQCFISLMMMT